MGTADGDTEQQGQAIREGAGGDREREERERERRWQAISALAQQADPSAGPSAPARVATRPVARKRAGGPRLRLVLAAVLAAVVAASGTLLYLRSQQRPPATPGIPEQMTLDLTAHKLYCPSGMRWSPDGRGLAVFVLLTSCNEAGTYYPRIAVFDARTGTLERTLDPYGALGRLGVKTPAVRDMAWSDDGKTLTAVVGYNAFVTDAVPGSGLLAMPLDGGDPRYVAGPAAPWTSTVVWDLRAMKAVTVIDGPLPVAARYAWTSDGTIVPSNDAGGAGGASPWDGGILVPVHPGTLSDVSGPPFQDHRKPPVAVVYESRATLRSPDGRYAAFDAPMRAVLAAQAGGRAPSFDAVTCEAWKYLPLCGLAAAPALDPALQAVAKDTLAGYSSRPQGATADMPLFTGYGQAQIARRPDGRVLAALLPGDGFDGQSPALRVTLLRGDTGEAFGALKADRPYTNGSLGTDGDPQMAWSPSGAQLALFDYYSNRITIWGAVTLLRCLTPGEPAAPALGDCRRG